MRHIKGLVSLYMKGRKGVGIRYRGFERYTQRQRKNTHSHTHNIYTHIVHTHMNIIIANIHVGKSGGGGMWGGTAYEWMVYMLYDLEL